MNKWKRGALSLGALGIVLSFQNCGDMRSMQRESLSSQQRVYLSPSIAADPANPSETNQRGLNLKFTFSIDNALSIKTATCTLDSAPPVDCASGSVSFMNVADGDHSVKVALSDSMNQDAEMTVLVRVDATAPVLTISQPPPAVSGSAVAIAFAAMDAMSAPVTFECALDAAAFAACTSPVNLTNLVAGARAYKVRAKDKLGNVAESTLNWSVDLAAPVITISAMPAAVSNSRAASFTFSGTLSGAAISAFQCSLDNAAFAACTSPVAFTNLADGNHSFRVAGRDNNNQFLNPVSYTWRIDTLVPAAPVLTANVGVNTNLTSAQISFTAADASGIGRYQCSLNGAAFADCTSPLSLNNLAQAQHTLNVRAFDVAGNMSPNGTFAWRVDTTAPVVTITSGPLASTMDKSATFMFTSSDAGAGIQSTECQLDSAAFAACASPYTVSNLGTGSHTVRIQVRDRAGNMATAMQSWMVFAEPPNGALLYANKCASCHGALASSTKLGRTAAQIQNAILTVPTMNFLAATTPAEEIQAIADSLKITTTNQARFQCGDQNTRGLADTRLQRLSSSEYANTLSDIFGQDVVTTLAALTAYPGDSDRDSMASFNPAHARDHVEAILNVALELSQKVVANTTYLNRVAPACVSQGITAGSIADSCITQFAREFGLKIHRRSLSAAQEQAYLAVFKDAAISTLTLRQRVETLMARIIQAPEAQYIWTFAPTPAAPGSRARVDAFTVASRLSYRLTGSTPDATLLAAAAAGNLTTLAQVQAQADRLINTPRARQKMRAMMYHWLRLHKVATPTAIAAGAAGVSTSDTARINLKNEVVTEALDYADYVIFDANGTISDLMNSDVAFPRSADAAKLFATGVATTAPVRATNGRKGLIMRPAILFSGTDRDAPIKRGVALRVRVLCDDVPPPPADIDTEIATISGSFDHSLFSSRDVAEKMTGAGSCVTCHARLNSLGYALSAFGPLGEVRAFDRSYNPDGTVKNQFPVNSAASNLDVVTPGDSVADHNGLAGLMAQAQKPKSCFSLYAFRASRNRLEMPADNCQLSDIEAAVSGPGMTIKQGWIKNAASEDIFWKGF